MAFDSVLDAARALSPSERVRLAEQLWDELSPADWPAIDAEWKQEVARRSAAFDRGEMSSSSWDEVKQRVRQQARLDD